MVRVKNLVAGHHRYQIFSLRQVDDVVRPARYHMHGFNFFTGDLELHSLARIDVALSYQAVARNDDEQLPLGVVPVLPLGDAGAADVDAHLTAVGGMHQFRERATVIHVHLQGILKLVRWQIGQVQGIQLLGKAAVRHLGHHKRGRLCLELLQQIHNLAECDLMRDGHAAVAAVCFQNGFHAVKFTVLLPALEQIEHTLDEVVDVEQLKLGRAVVDGKRLIVGDRPAECADGAVVLGAAVPHQIRKAVNRDLGTRFIGIVKEQLLARLFAAAVLAVAEAARERGLNGGRQHYRRLIAVLFQAIEQRRRKAEVALHKIVGIFGAVDARKVEHKVRLSAISVQLVRGRIDVVLVNLVDLDVRAGSVLAVADIFQVVAQGGSHHALCACYKNIHSLTSGCTAVQSGTSAPSGTTALLQIVTLLPIRTHLPTFA